MEFSILHEVGICALWIVRFYRHSMPLINEQDYLSIELNSGYIPSSKISTRIKMEFKNRSRKPRILKIHTCSICFFCSVPNLEYRKPSWSRHLILSLALPSLFVLHRPSSSPSPPASPPSPSKMVQHWRAAGMTYLKYSNTCADLLRRVVKDSVKSQKKATAGYTMARAEWSEGKVVSRCTSSCPCTLAVLIVRIATADFFSLPRVLLRRFSTPAQQPSQHPQPQPRHRRVNCCARPLCSIRALFCPYAAPSILVKSWP